ncbi:beta-hydroxyacyl-ACP dehydratase [Cohnella endophytica]|uniref:Beta-hydroxyacyl-ACP dehydratase n=1 Tax=Cohnella endophytica TaxID=2419778 RepID=A0A494XWB6_9BACL|nr:3-hydroxyacyl-ACP dehydratase FabZ [Cohnella endophytica]RKP54145.1 beta-hydroxyacyl-ACP dehydratase [Cohnella endophytica]
MKPLYTYDEVRQLLPQSYPFLFIDVVEALVPGERIICRKNITGNEWMIPGHFPDKTIYPGVLLIESMAQSAILLGKLSPSIHIDDTASFLLTAVKSRFVNPVVPGDQLRIECVSIKWFSAQGMVEATIRVRDETVAKAELIFSMARNT